MIVIIIVLITIIFSIILGRIFKDKEKVDKGFEFVYYKLSYRRKFIRTIVSLPFLAGCLGILYYLNLSIQYWSQRTYFIILTIFIIAYAIQLVYNYKMWKKEEE